MTTIAAVKIGDSLQQALNGLFGFLPNLLAFLVILIVGYIIARVVKGIVTKLLQKAGLDKALHSGQTGEYVEKLSPGASPSKLVGTVGFWLIFLFVLSAAIGALRIPAVTSFMNQVLAYLPNVIAAVIIFVLAGAIAGAVAGLVAKLMGDTPTGKLVALDRARADHGDRRLHDPQPATDRARDRDHHLRRAPRLARARHGPRLRARRPRGGRSDAVRRLRQGPGAARPGPS
jgi:Mechanosensitive ion channel, conserved TM helix